MPPASPQNRVYAPLYFNDDVIGVVNERYVVVGNVARKSVKGYRIEYRSSFKHPIIGIVFGVSMVSYPVYTIAHTPFGSEWFNTFSIRILAVMGFIFCFGATLLVIIIQRRDHPWLVFVTDGGEVAFPLNSELGPEAKSVLRKFWGEPLGRGG